MTSVDVLELIRPAGELDKTIVGYHQKLTYVDVLELIRAAGQLQQTIVGYHQKVHPLTSWDSYALQDCSKRQSSDLIQLMSAKVLGLIGAAGLLQQAIVGLDPIDVGGRRGTHTRGRTAPKDDRRI